MKPTKDHTVKTILTIAIGLLYPVVIYLLVTLILPVNREDPSSYYDIQSSKSHYLPQIYFSLLIALTTLFAAVYAFRPIKELFKGLVAGASVVIVIATIMLYSLSGMLDEVDQAMAIFTMLVSGVLQFTGLALAERNLSEEPDHHTKPAPHTSPLPPPHTHTAPHDDQSNQ